jgi:hypothetical protein
MEQAIFISRIENLKYYTPQFLRLYFGNEFCEHLIPSVAELRQVLDFVGEKGLDFTLVTPYATDRDLKRLEGLFRELAGRKPGSEVVFNDYGVLRILNSSYPELEPVMGRLLHKMKRGPRLMTVISKLPPSTVEYFRSTNLTVPILGEFLNQHGVKRVELDNLLQGFDFSLDNALRGSLYFPYAYVSTTRFCLSSSCDVPEKEEVIGIFPCQRECQQYTFYMKSEVMPVILIRKGNTIFFENEVLPEDLEGRGINRIVNEPEIPM